MLMRVGQASAYEVVTIPDRAAIPSALARDMGIAPEITRVQAIFGDFRRIASVKGKQVGATLGPVTLPTLPH